MGYHVSSQRNRTDLQLAVEQDVDDLLLEVGDLQFSGDTTNQLHQVHIVRANLQTQANQHLERMKEARKNGQLAACNIGKHVMRKEHSRRCSSTQHMASHMQA